VCVCAALKTVGCCWPCSVRQHNDDAPWLLLSLYSQQPPNRAKKTMVFLVLLWLACCLDVFVQRVRCFGLLDAQCNSLCLGQQQHQQQQQPCHTIAHQHHYQTTTADHTATLCCTPTASIRIHHYHNSNTTRTNFHSIVSSMGFHQSHGIFHHHFGPFWRQRQRPPPLQLSSE
jgi:hypothetical protein